MLMEALQAPAASELPTFEGNTLYVARLAGRRAGPDCQERLMTSGEVV